MYGNKYADLISIENILETWECFLRGKRHRKDVVWFQAELAENLVSLHRDLCAKTYKHGPYLAFNISDPKPRNIHKAMVYDRLAHHIIYRELYPYFEPRFIFDSYSCRINKGTHRAIDRFRDFAGKVSRNNTRTCYVLKCDVRKFFASINQDILMKILVRHVADEDILMLLRKVLSSFYTKAPGIGLPLGNLTSQLFANVYMHELDMFVKQELRVKYYIRYADDFVVLSDDKSYLRDILGKIERFVEERLHLKLHNDKVYIKTYASGVDFLGWIHFPHYRQIRTSTKKKIIRNTKYFPKPETVNSYRGLLFHGQAYKVQKTAGIALY